MKYLQLFIFLFIINYANGQKLFDYEDSIQKFKIGIPEGWKYGKTKLLPDLSLVCINPINDKNYGPVENFNINIIHNPNSNLNSSFSELLKANSSAKGYKKIEDGSKWISGLEFKWVLSLDVNPLNNELMYNYAFITYLNSKSYILTLVAAEKNFSRLRPLFDSIALSLRIMR